MTVTVASLWRRETVTVALPFPIPLSKRQRSTLQRWMSPVEMPHAATAAESDLLSAAFVGLLSLRAIYDDTSIFPILNERGTALSRIHDLDRKVQGKKFFGFLRPKADGHPNGDLHPLTSLRSSFHQAPNLFLA
jgi:hypothetical protein